MKTELKMKLAVFALLLVVIPLQANASSCFGKTVLVWVLDGQSLTGDGLQDPDPYVVVKIGKETKKSRVLRSNENPSWHEKLTFHSATDDVLEINVWDEDKGIRVNDDHLGTCMQRMVLQYDDYSDIHCNMKGKKGFVNLMYKCL